jgi:hypothetical protein
MIMNDEQVQKALDQFLEAAEKHTLATEEGDYQTANANHELIRVAIDELDGGNRRDALLSFLEHPNFGVQVWASASLLKRFPDEAISALERIAALDGIIAFNAKMTLQEWRAGRLRL